MSEQQKQTHQYFTENAEGWQDKATSEKFNAIENRHNAVIAAMEDYDNSSKIFDVGCGTGQLCIHASRNGWDAVGLDFAQTMIDQCIENNSNVNANAEFLCDSIFEYKNLDTKYQIISAQGFIEYISPEQLNEFLAICSQLISDDGSIVIGSRNRLFNLHSVNNFTKLEVDSGDIIKLAEESTIFGDGESMHKIIHELNNFDVDIEHFSSHPKTGIDVSQRYQYTPSELMKIFKNSGFECSYIYPVNFHPFPTSLNKKEPFSSIYNNIATHMSDNHIREYSLVPYCSSYVMSARLIK